jgi:hypothetical protein
MNENNPITPPPVPPRLPPPPGGWEELGENPEEQQPIPGIAAAIESILRQPRRVMYQLRQPGAGKLVGGMLLISIVCALIYGVVVGSFSGGDQWWAAPVKIAGGLMVSTVICLPSLYIFACLSGSQARLMEIVGMVSGLLLLMTILLIGFAPVAWLFSQSTNSLCWMGTLHILFWLVSTIFGLRFLNAAFSHSRAKSNAGLSTWIVIFVLVVLQMSTALRPIVGRADTFLPEPEKKKFFLTHWFDCMREGERTRQRNID